nr:NINE protein [Gordonia sp. NB41Y]
MTGEPLSDKSKVTAGLLQLFLGGFAAGRFYIGDMKIASIQLGLNVLSWILFILGIVIIGVAGSNNSDGGAVFGVLLMFVGIAIIFAVSIWVLIDAIMMFTGSVRDGQGRKLRG